ncbi:hypothetical protein EVAR_66473_1 [Eumeta japonica]|uniref:Uncharacterized protein n=1 Tax=Eumeta variegata TaxID=151549 RepID=A0A4C1ZYV9_EUMVA|nr:hypothetical protein EVAR_66473_1 [Eumeta japonica]
MVKSSSRDYHYSQFFARLDQSLIPHFVLPPCFGSISASVPMRSISHGYGIRPPVVSVACHVTRSSPFQTSCEGQGIYHASLLSYCPVTDSVPSILFCQLHFKAL